MKKYLIYSSPFYHLALEGTRPARLGLFADDFPALYVPLAFNAALKPRLAAGLYCALMRYAQTYPKGKSIDLVEACQQSGIISDDCSLTLTLEAAFALIYALARLGLCSFENSPMSFTMSEAFHFMAKLAPSVA